MNISQVDSYLTWLGRCIDKDGELDAVFLCWTNTTRRLDPREPHIHTIESGRDTHRQCVINDCEAGYQLVTMIGATVEHFQRALGVRLYVHLKDVQRQPVSDFCPKQLQQTLRQQWGPKFTDNLTTILRQFLDFRQSYDNWRIHRTFTTIVRPILRRHLMIGF